MLKKSTLLALVVLFTCCSQLIWAQNITQTIRGEVLDVVSGIPLIGAEVYVGADLSKGTTTDVDGQFIIEDVTVGRQTFYCRYLGYEDAQLANIEISSGKSPYLTIRMKESIAQLAEVEIIAKRDKAGTINPSALVSARTFSMEEASNFAGSFNDPARMAQSFAGAASPDDEGNEIIVRGNSPRGVSWRMQGLEIPNPNHYREEGGSGGSINVIPDIVLSNSDFLTGAFPSEYGNALSGVFDLNLRKGNSVDHEIALQAGFLGLQAAAEGPISRKNNSSYLFNYRYSTITILEAIGLDFTDEDEITPVFQDAAMHIHLPSTPYGSFSLYGLWGRSIAGSAPVRDSTQWFSEDQRYIYSEEYNTGVVGLNHTHIFKNNRTSISSALSYNIQSDLYRDEYIQDDYSDLLLEREKFDYNTWRAKTVLKHKVKPQLHLETGILFDHLGFDIGFGERIDGEFNEFLEDKSSTQYWRWYGQVLLRPSDKLTVNGGVHLGYFALNDQFIPEPRLSVNYKLSNKSAISYGSGLHSRLEPISLYLAKDFEADGTPIQRNKNLELTKSWHHVLGYNYRINEHWRILSEAYYQYLFDVPVFPTPYGGESALNFGSGFTNNQLLNVGEGRNLGIELTIEKFMNNGHFLLFTSSFFDSKYKNTDGDWIDTRYNIQYTSNLLSGKEWPVGKNKSNYFGVNGRLILHGGLRYTSADEEASQQNGFVVLDRDQQFSERLPNFFRFDTSVKYRKNKPKWSWTISLDIQNLTNRSNVFGRYYSVSNASYFETYQLGLIPVLNFRVEI